MNRQRANVDYSRKRVLNAVSCERMILFQPQPLRTNYDDR